MNCAACAADVPAGASFCPKCGHKVGAAPPSPDGSPASGMLRRTSGDDDTEQQLWSGGYSGKAMIGSWIAGAVVSVGLIVLAVMVPPSSFVAMAILMLLWIVLSATLTYRKLNISYELTNQRFIHQTGILTRSTDRIEVIDIDDVTFQQGIVQRMLNVGTIRISSSDRTHPELVLLGIDDVKRVADVIDDVRRQERRKRGLHIEQI
jgi:membrane protein YdbS with pleckstrin-like domain